MTRFSPGFLKAINGNDEFTKILLHMDGANGGTSFPDVNAGGSAHTWTATGATTVTSGQKFGTAIMQAPYIDTTSHADFYLGSGDWAFDFWFDTLGLGNGTTRNICGQVSAAFAFATMSFYIQINTANKLFASVSTGAAGPSVTGTTAISASGLHHVQFSRTGNNLQLYLDGVQEGGNTAFSSTIPDSTKNFAIGRSGEYTLETFAGLIDEFRLSVGTPRNTANFTPPTSAYS